MKKYQKLISKQSEWDAVKQELEDEHIKLMSYDHSLIELCGNLKGKKILDYGSGPGVLAQTMTKLGASVFIYDINSDFCNTATSKLGEDKVYRRTSDIPNHTFDIIICNLVLCIVPDDEVPRIMQTNKEKLSLNGTMYVGFCNPKLYNVAESQLDYRFPTGDSYVTNHRYKKVKKEGNYEIIEDHRPIEWYKNIFMQTGFSNIDIFYTPEYDLNKHLIHDFIIFKLSK